MTNATATIATKSSKSPKRSKFDAIKRMLPQRSARLTAGLSILGLVALIAIFLPMFTQDPNAISNIGLSAPSGEHLLGTTKSGQDVLAQLGYSTRGSLIIGLSVGVIAIILSTFFGVLGTYIGGWVDELFSLITNVMLVIPGLPLTIVIAAMIPQKGTAMLIAVLSVTAWAGGARVLRAQTLSMRGRDYVLAAKIAGERPWRVICVEILPNLLPVMASQFTFGVVGAILGESSLSFIGLGSSNQYSLGTMLFYAQNGSALNAGAWWWFLPPGLMIALLGAGLSFINFSIDEVINPRLRDMRKAEKDIKEAARKAKRAARNGK
ncbi:ABC transporter permease [Bifidobacterium oedipodis]|uniref:ABC transporter permease n=1 Tax=Bifidobacterium oedipodis TaxID=2675322 RepID=A0A7Y0ENV7_9BIFI|nr:ABC transporter permease [Bifidobacterium sp. DSM 109957]NMM93714.1 ABC transporter permease [Bifidobacterium sp. DSM 109957]